MVNPIRRLRNCVVWVLAGVLCAGGVAEGKDRFPYTVYTVADDTPIYSGPGESFYATDLLPAGSAIEVHKREPGGWLAVRPPEKSFSWVPGRKLHVAVGDRSARVIADDAVSWIGSRVETVADHCWQVPLDRGERIVVLGHRELTDDKKGTTETWYQIAPPNGEFRWIHAEDVQRHRPGGDVPLATNEADSKASSDADDDANRDVASNPETRQASAETPVRRTESKTAGRDSQVAPVQYRADWSPRAAARQPRRMDVASVPTTDVPAATTSPEISRELEDLQLLMTQLSTQEPGLWNLAPLRARAETLIDRGANPLERGKARLMLEKIEEYEELQQRHIRTERNVSLPPAAAAAASGFTGMSGLSGGATENVNTPIGSGLAAIGLSSLAKTFSSGADSAQAASAAPRVEPRFDGTGWLLPVHSTKRVAPPYALLDDQGKVLQYVTPSPGLNLHRYERKRVGVYGQKGNVATLNAPHLTAHRIVDLDRQASRTR